MLCASLTLSACAGVSYSDRQRVHVSKKEGQAPVVTKTPLSSHEGLSVLVQSRDDVPAPGALDTAPPAQPALEKRVMSPEEEQALRRRMDPDDETAKKAPCCELEAGADTLAIFSALDTSFHTTAGPSVAWSDTIVAGGVGGHGTFALFDDDLRVALTGGFVSSDQVNQNRHAGGVFARETLHTDCLWASADVQAYPEDWIMTKLAAGIFGYDVHSRLETNAAAYEYDGLSGLQVAGAIGVGAGLQTPWSFPLKAAISSTLWLSTAQFPRVNPIETGMLQVSANLLWRF